MFSDQFYEERLSVREQNMKLLLETVTYIAIKERDTCIIAMETVTCIIVTERPTNIPVPVTESTTSKPAKMQQTSPA